MRSSSSPAFGAPTSRSPAPAALPLHLAKPQSLSSTDTWPREQGPVGPHSMSSPWTSTRTDTSPGRAARHLLTGQCRN
eukprot:3166389-Rhodomonas_salina.1